MNLTPPPTHLSAEAAAYLEHPPPPPTIDYDDHPGISALREEIHAEWLAGNDQLADPWVWRNETIADVPVVYFASDDALLDGKQIIVHIHGGSYFCGSPMTNASMIVPIAQRSGLPVVSIDYRLAPEHPFPAGADDCLAVVSELATSHEVAAMYGESAGGGLALTSAVGLRDAGLPLPRRLALLSPWNDLTTSGDTYKTMMGIDPDFTDPAEPVATARMYADGALDHPRASPLYADHTGLPPTLIQVGGREILLSDSIRTAAAMRRAGCAVTLDVWDGLWHVWQLWHHVPEAMDAFDELAAFLVPPPSK